MVESAAPSPYQRAVALLDDGRSITEIHQTLIDEGLPEEDAQAVIRAVLGRPRADPPDEVGEPVSTLPEAPALLARPSPWSAFVANAIIAVLLIGFGVGTIAVMAPTGRVFALSGWAIIAGVMWFFAALGRALEGPSPAPPEELPDDSVRERCALHPTHASVGSCPRCGRFACTLCAPPRGFRPTQLCVTCESTSSVLAGKVRAAARAVSATLALTAVGFGAALVMAPPLPEDAPVKLPRGSPMVVATVFGALALAQWAMRHPAPGVVGAVLASLAVFAGLVVFDEVMTGVTLAVVGSMPVAVALMSWRLMEQRKGVAGATPRG